MNYGFVKVAAAVPRVKVADCKFNSERLEGLITIAEGKGVQILTFPEMSQLPDILVETCSPSNFCLNRQKWL